MPVKLMVEQPDAGKGHNHPILIASLDYMVIPHGASRLGDILDPAFISPVNIVPKGEKRIGPQSNLLHLIQPCPFSFPAKYRGLYPENLLPGAFRQHVFILFANIHINGIIPVRTADAVHKRQIKHLWGLA